MDGIAIGRINIVLGPMCSGKTTLIAHYLDSLAYSSLSVLTINTKLDKRYSDEDGNVITHNQMKRKCESFGPDIPMEDEYYSKYDVIIIDELHTFSSKTIKKLIYLSLVKDKTIIGMGLPNGVSGSSFKLIDRLVSFASTIRKLSAFCDRCKGLYAIHSSRIGDPNDLELMGGKERYETICDKCFVKKTHDKGTLIYKDDKFINLNMSVDKYLDVIFED